MHFSPKLFRDKIRVNEFWAKLVKNVSTIVVGQGGASAFNMLTSFVSAGFLGVAGYGSLMIGQTYMQAIDALLNFQSWQSVIRYGSICLEKRDERGLAACIKAAFLVDVISAVAGCVISFAIVGLVAGFLGWDSAATAAAVVFCFEILAHIEGAPTGLLRLFDRFNYVAIHAVVMAAVKLLFVAASIVLFGNNVIVIACAYCAADVIKSLTLFLIAVHVARRRVGLLKIVKARRVDLPAGYISFTIWSNLDTSADAPIQYFDVFFLSLLSSEVVGVFKFFRQLLSVLSLLSRPVQQAIMPQLAELIAKGLNSRAYEVVRKIEKVVAKVVAPCAAIACLVVPPALAVFMDPLYGVYWYLFATLAVLAAASIVFSAIHPCFNAYGLSKQSTIITLISNVVYLVACYLLLGKLGVMAIPLAMALQYTLAISLKDIYIRKVVLD